MNNKQKAIAIFNSAIDAVLPKNFIKNKISYKDQILTIQNDMFDLKRYKNIYLFGSGKASISMTKELELMLKERVFDGLVISNHLKERLKYVPIFQSTHPLPSKKSLEAANLLITKLQSMKKDDFFVYCLSGGSSSLIEKPIANISIDQFIKITDQLLLSGKSIDEINRTRKKLSAIKGGGLAKQTKADGVVLVMSDVISNDLHTIASAPFLHDNTLPTDPKHYILADNYLALTGAKTKAEEFFQGVKIYKDFLNDDVKVCAKKIVHEIKNSKDRCLIFGGESRVCVVGDGKGGRNQELALWVLREIKDNKDITFLAGATDGIDGNSKASGGVVDCSDYDRSIDKFLLNNDSNSFLKQKNALLEIGDTNTNVMDIAIIIK